MEEEKENEMKVDGQREVKLLYLRKPATSIPYKSISEETVIWQELKSCCWFWI
jgi:hypothetical protein